MEEIILLGMGGHAHSVVDSIEREGRYHIAGFLDPGAAIGECYKDYRVIGTDDALPYFYDQGITNAFITVGYMGTGKVRERLYDRLKQTGYKIPNIIDPSAVAANHILMGEGNFVGKNAVINAGAIIGDMCIINTAAVIEHDCRIGNYVHLAVGSIVCGDVLIEERSFIGAGSVIIQGVSVGKDVLVGAGTVVTQDVADHMLRYGSVIKCRE